MVVDPGLLDAIRRQLHGEIIAPSDPRYDQHRRVWNGAIDRRPAAIIRCASADDVVEAVRLGREEQMATAIRGGGHSFPGLSTCDDGLVIDLGIMRGIDVDLASRTVRVQGGALLGDLDRTTLDVTVTRPPSRSSRATSSSCRA